MRGLVQFDAGDGETVVVEVDDEDPGYVRASAGEVVAKARTTLNQALEVLRPVAKAVVEKIDSLDIRKPTDIEVEMGIKLNAKTGAVLASAGGECHINLRLVWKQETSPIIGPGS